MAFTGAVKLPPNFDIQSKNAATEWKYWIVEFEDYLVSTGQDESPNKVKLSLLRNMMGHDSARIVTTLPMTEEQRTSYNSTKDVIQRYVSPRDTIVFDRFLYNVRSQKEGESFEHFLTDCRELLKVCKYEVVEGGESLQNQLLRDKIVHGVSDNNIREGLLRIENLTLDKATNYCRSAEQSKDQAVKFATGSSALSVDMVRRKAGNSKGKSYGFNKNANPHAGKENSSDLPKDKFKCRRCKTVHGLRECPAYGKSCTKCGIKNHFAAACRVKNVRSVEAKKEESCEESDDEPLFAHCVTARNTVSDVAYNKQILSVNLTKEQKSEWFEDIKFEGHTLRCKLDPGGDVTVMPLHIFKELKLPGNFRPVPTSIQLEGFEGSRVHPVGNISLQCTYKDQVTVEDTMVVDCPALKVCLFGLPGCLKLNLVKRVHSINAVQTNVDKFVEQNKDVFVGHGKFPEMCNIPTVEFKEPICHPPTRVAHSLLEPLKKELIRLESRKAIAKVQQIKESACVNRIVLVEKTNRKIRLCLDPTDLNQYVVRKPKLIPTVEEIAEKLKGKKFYSVFDLSEGFHHIPLNEESTWKCCFATPFGVYRYLVLPYGLTNAPELFLDEVEKYFSDIENVVIFFDDILVTGETEQIHDKTVSEIVERARKVGAKFNREKLQYKVTEVKYVGQRYSVSGMSMDSDRAKALSMLEAPQSREELQRVMGSLNYVRKYVPEMAKLMSPLCSLLRTKNEWNWLPAHDKCFKTIKEAICKAPALTPFDPKKKIVLQCDASKSGVGCCLFQCDENANFKLVACFSRTMNDAELNYGQTEKELLAIYFATQKFHYYIYGVDVDVQTDHKPLISIMRKPLSKIGSVRLQRLRLKLLNYSLNVYYVPGKLIHFADMLSRNSLKETTVDLEMLEMVHSVSEHLPMSEERQRIFRTETARDSILAKVVEYHLKGWPQERNVSPHCSPYYKWKDDLYVQSGLLFMGYRIVVPTSLRPYVLELVHKGHSGVNKSVSKARELFYWPELKTDVKNYVQKCRTCEKFLPLSQKQPLLPHRVPKLRYEKVSTDILEYGGYCYLVLIDCFSHWLEIRPISKKTSGAVIDAMQEVFTRFGYPVDLLADNNPFISFECKEYYAKHGITLKTCSPEYHRSNGLAEKAVGIGKQILRKSAEEKADYRELLLEYNNSPLSCLPMSPSQILNSRMMRTSIPVSSELLEPKVQRNVRPLLLLQQGITKSFHDRRARGKEEKYKPGDQVVVRTPKDKYWCKASVTKAASEPRSYWVLQEGSRMPVRRNTTHIKRSTTESKQTDKTIPPDLLPHSVQDVAPNIVPHVSRLSFDVSEHPHDDCSVQPDKSAVTTRSGRLVKPPKIFDI